MTFYPKIFIIPIFLCLIITISKGQSGNKIINYETFIKIEKNKRIETKSYLIQINNKQAAWISDIKIPYQQNEKLDILEATIINAQGKTVRTLKKKEITTKSNISRGSFYEDDFVKTFQLKWNDYPYQIKYSYKKTSTKFIYVAQWFPIVHSEVFTERASLKVEIPAEYEMTIQAPDGLKSHSDTLDKNIIHYWTMSDIHPLKFETLSPPYRELLPKVNLIPERFSYGMIGSFESWATYGQWQEELNKGLDALPESEQQKIDQMLTGIQQPKEKMKILYHYLQDHTRYVNVAIDIGGLQPYPATYVCDKKYGDCKALTMYMKALLKHAGIPSFYTKIYAGSEPSRIDKRLPSQQFNHVILCVPLGADTLWLENTANYLPYNYLGTFTQGRYGLLVDGENSKLVRTPSLKMKDVLEQSVYDFYLKPNGTGTVSVSQYLSGDAFENYKYVQHEFGENEQKEFIEKQLDLHHFKLQNWTFHHSQRDEPSLQLDLELAVSKQLRKIGELIALQVVPLALFDLEKPEKRKNTLRINFPVHKSDTLRYHLPFIQQYQVDIPENMELESNYGNYKIETVVKEEQLLVTRTFQLYKNDASLDEYPEFYQFIEDIKKAQEEFIIILNPLK